MRFILWVCAVSVGDTEMAAAFDLGMMLNTAPSANMVQQIACDLLTPYTYLHLF